MLTTKKLTILKESKRLNISKHILSGKLSKPGVMAKMYDENGLDETMIKELTKVLNETKKLIDWCISENEGELFFNELPNQARLQFIQLMVAIGSKFGKSITMDVATEWLSKNGSFTYNPIPDATAEANTIFNFSEVCLILLNNFLEEYR